MVSAHKFESLKCSTGKFYSVIIWFIPGTAVSVSRITVTRLLHFFWVKEVCDFLPREKSNTDCVVCIKMNI